MGSKTASIAARGCDLLERYIYLHGTNHEDLLGRPAVAWLRAAFERACVPTVRPHARRRSRVRRRAGSAADARSQGQGPLSLCGAWRRRHERARPIPGDDRRRRRAAATGPSTTASAPACAQQLERLGIAVVPQDGSGLGPDCAALVVSTAVEEQVADVAAARAHAIPIVHRSELLAHFVGGHRSIAVTGTSGKSTVAGDDLRDLERRRPRPVGHHRRRSARAPGARPSGQRVRRALGPARRRGRRERRLAGALCARHRRHPQSSARPQGDDRGRGDVRHACAPARARRWWWATPRISIRLPAARCASASAPRADIRGEDVELGPASSRFRVEAIPRSRCRCRARITSPTRLRQSPPASLARRRARRDGEPARRLHAASAGGSRPWARRAASR